MAIDDPLDQGEALADSDRRQQWPWVAKGSGFVEVFAQIQAALTSGNPAAAIAAAASAVKSIGDLLADSQSEFLQSVVISELRELRNRFDVLDARRQEYLNTDWLALWVDADRKARATRGREDGPIFLSGYPVGYLGRHCGCELGRK